MTPFTQATKDALKHQFRQDTLFIRVGKTIPEDELNVIYRAVLESDNPIVRATLAPDDETKVFTHFYYAKDADMRDQKVDYFARTEGNGGHVYVSPPIACGRYEVRRISTDIIHHGYMDATATTRLAVLVSPIR